jgi:peptidoglycan hydrolase CwlO-like protein
MSDTNTQIVLAVLAFLTGVVAWYARVKIAETKRKQPKAPSEVLFEGYEKLLKRYQEAIHERDTKIQKLEQAFEHVQTELNNALQVIGEIKNDNKNKDDIIASLESQLLKLRDALATEKSGPKV